MSLSTSLDREIPTSLPALIYITHIEFGTFAIIRIFCIRQTLHHVKILLPLVHYVCSCSQMLYKETVFKGIYLTTILHHFSLLVLCHGRWLVKRTQVLRVFM